MCTAPALLPQECTRSARWLWALSLATKATDGLTLPASKVSPLPGGGPFLRSAIFPVESCAQHSFHILTVGGLTRTR